MIPVVVLGVGVVVAFLLAAGRRMIGASEPLDTERPERWIVRHAPRWLRRSIVVLDNRVVGGAVVGVTFVAIFMCALVVGWIFSTIEDERGFARWDMSAAEYGAEQASAASTRVLDALTQLGGTGYLLAVMALLGVYHGVRRRDWGPAAYLAVVGIGVSALNNGLKLLIDRDRPDIAQLSGYSSSSFPSGHTAAAAACWAAIALVAARDRSRTTRTMWSFAAIAIAVIVAATRAFLGVHWVSDVIAGIFVGWTWFFVTTMVFGGRILRFAEPVDRIEHDQAEQHRP